MMMCMYCFESYRLVSAYSPVRCASQLFKVYFVFCCQSKFPNQTGVKIHKCMEQFVLGEF